MCIPSKFNVLYLLVALMSIEQSESASKLAEATQDLCKNKDRDDFELKLRATLLFRNTLILIDEGWLVYKIAHSNINNSYSQLMIDVLGKPLEEEWPAFKELANWTRIKPNVVSIYHVDIKTPFLYMIAKGMFGVCYNLNTSTFYDSGRPKGVDDYVQPSITDNGPTQFLISMNMKDDYCFFSKENQNINQTEFKPKCLWLGYGNVTWYDDGRQGYRDFFPMGYMYYTWNRTNQAVKNITVIDETDRDPHKVISPDFELENLDWHLPPGFVYEGDFHFFDRKNVYSFPISPLKMIDYPSEPRIHSTHPLKIIKVKDYFHCVPLNISGKTYPPGGYTLDPDTASNGIASWIWIVVGVTVLLLIVAIIALLVWYFSLRSKSHQSKGKTSSEAISKHDRATTATVKQSLQVKDKKK